MPPFCWDLIVVCVWSPGRGRPRCCPDHPTALPARRPTRGPSPSQPIPQQSGKPPQSPGRPGLPQRRSTPRRAAGYLERRRAWRMGPRGGRGPRRGAGGPGGPQPAAHRMASFQGEPHSPLEVASTPPWERANRRRWAGGVLFFFIQGCKFSDFFRFLKNPSKIDPIPFSLGLQKLFRNSAENGNFGNGNSTE